MISEFPLLVFTVFAGLAAGAYVAAAVFPPEGALKRRAWVLPVVCMVLLGIGLVGTLLHLQRPDRFLNAMANPLAPITQEAYWSIAFGVLLVVDVVVGAVRGRSPRALRVVGALAAVGLMAVTGLAYGSNYGVPAWCGWATFPLFFVGDVAMGFALYLVLERGRSGVSVLATVSAVAALLFAASCAGVAAQLAGAGAQWALAVAGCVLAAAGVAAGFLARKGGVPLVAASCACVLVAVVLVRYGFYAACAF